jgi:hypothetical protein
LCKAEKRHTRAVLDPSRFSLSLSKKWSERDISEGQNDILARINIAKL